MPYYAYILQSTSTGRFYVGHAKNIPVRLAAHNNNRTVSIKNRGPWKLVHAEEFATHSEAARRERHIKAMKSHRWIEELVRASR